MNDYYETLGIGRDAGADDIKGAYFKRVRMYPPERFPDEYKALRQAREVLEDTRKRAVYDRVMRVPEEGRSLYVLARQAGERGRLDEAISALEDLTRMFPDVAAIREDYARMLAEAGKTGKAAAVWESLCKMEPDNYEYNLALADAYCERSWRKKGIQRYERCIEMDGGDVRAWVGLIRGRLEGMEMHGITEIIDRALDAVREDDSEAVLSLYAYAYVERLHSRMDDGLIELLARMERSMTRVMPSHDSGIEQTIGALLHATMVSGRPLMVPHIRRLAGLLPRMSDRLRDTLDDAGDYYDVHIMTDNGYDEKIHDLLAMHLSCEWDRDDRLERIAVEYAILSELDMLRPQIARLKQEYPRLYVMAEDFLDEALSVSNPQRLMNKRSRALEKAGMGHVMRMVDGGVYTDGAFEEQETVRREEPKVGRNELCPCGSGKKWKRCCGG